MATEPKPPLGLTRLTSLACYLIALHAAATSAAVALAVAGLAAAIAWRGPVMRPPGRTWRGMSMRQFPRAAARWAVAPVLLAVLVVAGFPVTATATETADAAATGNAASTVGASAASGSSGSDAAEKLYQFQPDHAVELQQFTGRPWWDILSFCSGAMMAIKTEPEAQGWVRDEALRQLSLTLLPLLKQTGQPMEQLRAMSAKYAQGLQETRFLREESRQAGVMRVCLLLIPTQFRKDHPPPAAP